MRLSVEQPNGVVRTIDVNKAPAPQLVTIAVGLYGSDNILNYMDITLNKEDGKYVAMQIIKALI